MTEDIQQPPPRQRTIRSYVVRAGRMTTGQERAWQELWPQYGIDFTAQSARQPSAGQPLDLHRIFDRDAPRVLEIGFGVGDALLAYARQHPERDCIGVEVHPPGVGHLLLKVKEAGVANIRILCHDAVEVLEKGLASRCLDEAHIFFPDPWHKKRHHKRRLIQPPFVALLAAVMKPGGVIRLATDWQHYANQMREVIDASGAFDNLGDDSGFAARSEHRPITRFERRGHRLGHGVWDLAYRRRDI